MFWDNAVNGAAKINAQTAIAGIIKYLR